MVRTHKSRNSPRFLVLAGPIEIPVLLSGLRGPSIIRILSGVVCDLPVGPSCEMLPGKGHNSAFFCYQSLALKTDARRNLRPPHSCCPALVLNVNLTTRSRHSGYVITLFTIECYDELCSPYTGSLRLFSLRSLVEPLGRSHAPSQYRRWRPCPNQLVIPGVSGYAVAWIASFRQRSGYRSANRSKG